MRAACWMAGLILGTAPAAMAAPTPLEGPVPQSYVLRGVVGHSISVALPTHPGMSWKWEAPGKSLFAPPYKVSYASTASPEIWTFPLLKPGTVTLSFRLVGPDAKAAETRTIELQVLTPYEAQQHPLEKMLDTLLVR